MQLKNDLFLRTIRGEEVERPPIWLMRQAGRILPEYRAVRSSVKNFVALVKNPELCAEVTVQPIDALNVDAAILFSDILVIPEAMGLEYQLVEKKGPIFPICMWKWGGSAPSGQARVSRPNWPQCAKSHAAWQSLSSMG